jgi:hypothetical protein
MRCRLIALVFTSVSLPALVLAQDAPHRRFAIFVGAAVELGDQEIDMGARIGGAVTVASRSQRQLRIEASYGIFPVGAQATGPCVPPPGRCELMDDLRVLQVGATLGFVQPAGLMWTVGAGIYDVLASPQNAAYVRPGWTVGLTAPVGSTVFLEFGWHGILGPRPTVGFIPFGLGVRF